MDRVRITSNGAALHRHHQGTLSGDLPLDQGPPYGNEIRLVVMEIDGGVVGADDFIGLQRVCFGGKGEPSLVNDVVLSGGTVFRDGFRPGIEYLRGLVAEMAAALDKPVIDLRDRG